MDDVDTARATDFVASCPELATLELAPLPPELHAHVEVCAGCQLALELLAAATCAPFEPLLAAREEAELNRASDELLARHLAGCSDCRAVADTLPPSGDRHGDLAALPRVDPAGYALGVEVGRGGNGRVLAARDLRIGRPVAVKELLGRSSAIAARFEREARITARLQHPGIVPIYEIGTWPDGTPFYSMRMVEGSTLHKAIAAAPTLAARIALLPAVIAATEAVAFAHGQRIIHRDITPSNVMVGAYGETVVIDWGLAKLVSELDEPRSEPHHEDGLTGAGAVVGTAAYMPPEQANAGAVDERTDVYALGALLYHLLAGAPPYRGANVLDAVKAGPPPPIDQLAPPAPRDLVSIVTKAMARAPDDRYPTARELAEELNRFQTGRMVEAHAYTTAERMRRFVVRNRAPLVVTAIALVVLGVLGAIAIRRVIRESATSRATVLALLEEKGRGELLAGNSLRALAYFEAAEHGRNATPALRFMRASALREIATAQDDLDCGGVIRDLGFSPDGKLLLASCHDLVRVWRLADRAPVARLGPFPNGFDHLTYSHDGKLVVTWGGDGIARLWDAATFRLVRELPHAPGSTITFATFTPDDARVATSGYDGWARIWIVATGAVERAIQGSDALILHHLYGLLSKDGRHLLTFTIEGIGAGWELATGKKIGDVQHGSLALGGDLAPDGTRAVTCGMNRLVKVWDTASPQLIWQLAGATDAVVACKFSASSQRVIGTSHDGHAYVWDLRSGAMLAAVDHGAAIWTGHFSPDGERFVTIAVGGSVKVWDTITGGLLATHDTQGGQEAQFSPDGKLLVAGRGDGRLRIWVDPSGPLRATYAWRASEHVLAVGAAGTRALVEGADGWVTVRDTTTGAALASPRIGRPVTTAGERIVAVTERGAAVVLDARSGAPIAELPVVERPAELAISADGRRVVVGFGGRACEVWSVDTRTAIATLDGTQHALIAADGARVLGWRAGRPPRVWTIDTGAPIELATDGAYQPAGFALGGRAIVIDEGAGKTHVVRIYDTTTGVVTAVIDDVVAPPTLDPGGRFVTAILADHSVQLRDLETGAVRGFIGEALQQAQSDPRGELVAGIDKLGAAVLVLDAVDGRVLARWPIAHDPPSVRQEGFEAPRATAAWSPDGTAIVSMSQRLALWNASTEVTGRDLAQLVRRRVPWRIADGKLVPALASLHGIVKRGETLVPDARLRLVFRKPADLGAGSITWEAAAFENKPLPSFTTGPGGELALSNLVPGRYTVEIAAGGQPRVAEVDVDIEDEEVVLDLDALRAP